MQTIYPRYMCSSYISVQTGVFQKLRQRDEALEKEMEGLKSKIQELEQLAREKGLAGMFNLRHPHVKEGKTATPA